MDTAFRGLNRQSVVVYVDDVIAFSKKRSNRMRHLKKIFERCRKYKISLNPKKSVFAVFEENLFGRIIARSGIKVDSDHHTDPSPNQQESNVVFLGKDKLPPDVHLELCVDSETNARHDQEGCSL